jgi:signal transduction histidine kinase
MMKIEALASLMILIVMSGFGLLLNSVHHMDIAHKRLNQEVIELKLINSLINELDQLLIDRSMSGIEDQGAIKNLQSLFILLEKVRDITVRSERFEDVKHLQTERQDFVKIYERFRSVLSSMGSSESQANISRLSTHQHDLTERLLSLRDAVTDFQNDLIVQIDQASLDAQQNRRSILGRTLQTAIFVLVILSGLGIWFSVLIRKHTQSLIQQEQNLTISLLAKSLSHEIRNPLGIIKSTNSVIRNQLSPQSEEYEVAGYLNDEVERIDNLIDQLMRLDPTRQPNFREFDPLPVIEQVIVLLTAMSQKHDVAITLDHQAGKQKIKCDEYQFKQVLINLLLNALEASSAQGIIEIQTLINKNNYGVLIKDNGHGFESHLLKKVGSAFFTTKNNGSGLGLFTAKNMVEMNGGRFHIESIFNQGTTVQVDWKIAQSIQGT